ncbi:MAG: LysR substrate-binding domain-containing protein [Paracoccaceae bacterium]
MIAPRRFLPSVSSLLALEAVERLGTATAAAEELALTHSAVSRQLRTLEEQIGVPMFRRAGKGLEMTPAGADYALSIRDYLHDLARASLRVRAAGSKSSLALAVLPAFGTHWLMPRLKSFAARHPEIAVSLATRLSPFDFARERFDAAIHFGRRDWRGVEYLQLAREEVIPAASPDLVPKGRLAPGRLAEMPLLHLESRPGAWEDWFARHGVEANPLRGMLFDQFSQLTAAAALGLGAALLPRFLAEANFRTGLLRPLTESYAEAEGSYFLVWPQIRGPGRPLQLFLRWLNGELAGNRRPFGAG